jgi:hypothetical protein
MTPDKNPTNSNGRSESELRAALASMEPDVVDVDAAWGTHLNQMEEKPRVSRRTIRQVPGLPQTRVVIFAAAVIVLVAALAFGSVEVIHSGSGTTTPAQRPTRHIPLPTTVTSCCTTTTKPKPPSTTRTTPPQAPVPAAFRPMNFTATSATDWWLLGSAPCSAGSCPAIITTTDGGTSWRSVTAPGPPLQSNGSAANGGVSHLRFATSEIGWAFGPGLYATYDGGEQWHAIHLGGWIQDLEPGLGRVYATVFPGSYPPTCATTGSTCPNEQLWTSPVVSQQWSLDSATGDFAGDVAVHGDNVYLQPAESGLIVIGLLVSTDQGGHFTKFSGVGYGRDCELSPTTDTVIWAFCSTGNFGKGLVSNDGGRTFAVTPLGPQCPNSSTLVGASATVAIGACAGTGDPLEQTLDGGQTFIAVQSPPDQIGEWSLIGFTDSEDGYAFWIDESTVPFTQILWHTTDGGAHWSEVTIP